MMMMMIIAAHNHYKNLRQDEVAQVVHCNLCKKFGCSCNETWYDYSRSPEAVVENDQVKVGFQNQTDHHLDHNRLDCRCSSVALLLHA